MSSPAPDIEVTYDEKYKEVFVNRLLGGIRNGYFEYELISETSDFKETMKTPEFNFNKTVLKRTIHGKIVIPPMAFKEVVQLMEKQLVEYENIFGKIPTNAEIQDKSGHSDLK